MGSSNFSDAFVSSSLTRVQSACHQLICCTINKFVYISGTNPRSVTSLLQEHFIDRSQCEEVRCEYSNYEPAGVNTRWKQWELWTLSEVRKHNQWVQEKSERHRTRAREPELEPKPEFEQFYVKYRFERKVFSVLSKKNSSKTEIKK